MSHLDPSVETQPKVHASPFGLGVVLSEGSGDDLHPVAYVSRTFTDAERRYSQTEREALAVVWACERFHIYLYGQEFKLYTDHKALEVIYRPRSKPSPRIERWSLRSQPYRFTIHHMPGQQNPADVLSRTPLTNQPCRETLPRSTCIMWRRGQSLLYNYSRANIGSYTKERSSPASTESFEF